jgi:hypothetical protein
MVLNNITLLTDVSVCSMDNKAMNSLCGPNSADVKPLWASHKLLTVARET